METFEEKKLSATDAIRRMILAINAGQEGDFYKVAGEFSDSLAHGGNTRWKIQGAIAQRPMRLRKLDDLPHNIKHLLIQSPQKEENVFLSDYVKEFIKTLLFEWEHKEAYAIHNIPARNKILLHGPTGNGKTTIARYIARKSGLPFVEINSDSVIDSHIGSTSSNIHNVLNTIKEPCVLFWDEIDSIGYKRGAGKDAAAHENSRMVNSILINIERLENQIIFIGATNRVNVLDAAFMRRFDVKLEIPAPSTLEKCLFVDQLLTYHKLPVPAYTEDLTHLESFSDIKNKIIEIGRAYILTLTSKS
jgi:MoxR-like ATPase